MSSVWQQEERLFLHLGNERETNGSGRRYFSRGGVKYALLELLQQENMHGYQMMKALEEQSGGTYKPSAGSIYPTLQMLRDQGFVNSSKIEGKKVFEITDEGRAYLLEERDNEESGSPGEERQEPGFAEEEEGRPEGVRRNRRLTPKGKELLHLLKAAERAALADPDKAQALRTILHGLLLSLRHITEGTEQGRETSH
ncbi:PadR family transcriptional regulator [Paenibacillus sp. PR3]|uniref:PadR family transcriptional regulator n=1 Tax=Paenibacillus terricola TaxID=2763503 RepID=A0ABR8MQA1_9BACL|nr:PadR family transcriptional regulator [Paenibacillus terricola]MBD3918162.1 PadR family transcriptional regulator [Paenibacillus terricola]